MADEENAMHVASGLSMDDFTAQLTRAREGGTARCRARQHGLRVRRFCLQSRGLGPQWFASGRRDRLGAHSGEDGPAVRDRLRAAA